MPLLPSEDLLTSDLLQHPPNKARLLRDPAQAHKTIYDSLIKHSLLAFINNRRYMAPNKDITQPFPENESGVMLQFPVTGR